MKFLEDVSLILILQCLYISANTGKEYMVVFMEHVVSQSNLDIFVTTTLERNVSVQVTGPQLTSTQLLSVTRGVVAHAAVDTNVALTGNQKADKGILISSDGDVVVQCFSTSTSANYPDSVGGYLALPTTALATRYIVTTFCEDNGCIMAVVGVTDGTDVNITVKLPPGKRIRLEGKRYRNGDVITTSVNRFQAIQLYSSGSFSGTSVAASSKVAVFVGADQTSIDGSSMDAMTEQIPPLSSWGMDYILIPFPQRSKYDFISVTAQLDNTLIEMYGSQHTMADAGSSITLQLLSDSPAYLWANKRILVLQLSTSRDSSNPNTDPSMLAVPSVDQWLSHYVFVSNTTTTKSSDNILVLVTNNNCISYISVRDENRSVSLSWTAIANTTYSFSQSTLTKGSYEAETQSLEKCPVFGGYLFGPGYHSAWAVPLGQSFKSLPDERPIPPSSVSSSEISPTVVSDLSAATEGSSTLAVSSSSVIGLSSLEISLSSSFPSFTSSPSSTLEWLTSSETAALYTSSELSASSNFGESSEEISLETTNISSPFSSAVESSFLSSVESLLLTETTSSSLLSDFNELSTEGVLSLYPSSTSYVDNLVSTTSLTSDYESVYFTSSTTESSSSKSLCSCRCIKTVESPDQIKRKLIVDKKQLSSTKRKLYSVVDNRMSSVAIGTAGIVFIAVALAVIASADIVGCLQHLSNLNRSKNT